ncbi:uroporphyrinogen-III synthase [uncultured Thiothrix sp.]|uniref:uroporphyrinogen-III synthase n=1 Tax=uncultured Thiothrix sp. TaxID=223185 RepID=UPI00261411AB|nr:uroporphyrinogen-III synthase [uncultured Thiothrix sp.]
MNLPLTDIQVLVTRPAHQAGRFYELLLAAGAKPQLFPVMAIEPINQAPDSLLAIHQQAYDWVIFISANAVEYGLNFFHDLTCFKATKLGAIGKQTAASLNKYGLQPNLVPEQGFTSEDFLTLPPVQDLTGQQVLIVRGDAGREVLAETLSARGAKVSYATVYQRSVTGSAQTLKQLHDTHGLDIICITSSEILRNLLQLLEPETWIYQYPIVVGSERISFYAQQRGFKHKIIVARSPADDEMLAALIQWQQDNQE